MKTVKFRLTYQGACGVTHLLIVTRIEVEMGALFDVLLGFQVGISGTLRILDHDLGYSEGLSAFNSLLGN